VLASSAVVVLLLAVAIATRTSDQLRDSAIQSAVGNAESIVRGYVDPIVTEGSLDLGAVPDSEVDAQLDRLVASGDMRRLNVFTRDGRILHSTVASLTGLRVDIDEELTTAFGGSTVAEFGTNDELKQASAQLPERFLEIYVPIRGTSDGHAIGVFEVYIDAGPIDQRVANSRAEVFLITAGAGSALLALLWLAFGGYSRRLGLQNQTLTELNVQLHTMAGDLSQREARFRSLVQNSSDVVTILGRGGEITYESDAIRRVLGHDPAARVGLLFEGEVHLDDRGLVKAMLEGLLAVDGASQTAEMRVRHADGSWRWVEAIAQNLLHEPAIGGVVLNFRDVTDRKRLEDQLQHEAFHDPLTGLANRALFGDRVTHALARMARQTNERAAVLFIDLDDFKVVNDSLGHAAGDELLTAVSERIRACLRRQDTASRLGGDEFGILIEETDEELAGQVAERILEALRQPFVLAARQIFVQASIGIALGNDAGTPGEGETADELLRNADAAMYTAKALGKGRFEFYQAAMHASALRRLELRGRLEASLEAGEFVLHYQPVVELVSGAMVGVEALVRWRQPDGHLAQPGEFIPLAEETGLIVPLGRWVLEEACRQGAEWHRAYPGRALSMAVNVASRQIQDPGFVETVRAVLEGAGLPPSNLVVEVTESALLDVGEATTVAIAGLKGLGIRIALDDFGTGYSSLSHLRRFPIDVLKIDRSFVDGIDGEEHGERALVRSIIRLARSLDLEIVAEGVERHGQVVGLTALGARLAQGFYFARPMEAAAIGSMLRADAQKAS